MRTDLKREIEAYRARPGEVALLEVPPLQYLAVDGRGDPDAAPAYPAALGALYPLAYGVRSLSRTQLGRDYVVMPLEALWWSQDMSVFTTGRDRSRWEWTLLTLVPAWVTAEHLDAVRAAAARKAPRGGFDAVRLEPLDEGLSVQTLHVGPYDEEAPVIAAMHEEHVVGRGLRLAGKHHEIYLNDARRTPPTKLRTILRQPVTR
jgi:hypothetical protein